MSRRIKGLFSLLMLLLVTLTLVACDNQAKKDETAVAQAKTVLAIEFKSPDTATTVTQDLKLPSKQGEVNVTWVSNNQDVIKNDGKVVRADENTVVELTATLKKGEAVDTKKFTLTVLAKEVVVDPDIAIVAEAKEALKVGFTTPDTAASVTQNLTLPAKQGDVIVTWATNNQAVITAAGVVTRPATDATVKLTATLTKGAVTDTKEFTLTVLAEEVVETGAKAALIAHYELTLANPEFIATEDLELVSKITGSDDNEYSVTWTVTTGSEYFSNTGVVTRPSFTEGDKTIVLKAELEDGATQTFYFLVGKLDQTVEEKINAALVAVTVVPSSPSGYQEVNFAAVETTKIDGEDVAVTWTTSDATVMTNKGELVSFEDAPEKTVTLTASITFGGVTLTKEIEFKVKGVETYASFLEALTVANFKSEAKVKVEGVSFYAASAGGYYLASENNMLAFVYGTKPATLKNDKLYDAIFTVDLYYGTFQIKNVSLSNERAGTLPTITPVEVTLEDIVTLPKPSEATPNHHTLYKLINVEVRVVDPVDNYKTFFVPIDTPAETVLTDTNSVMVYYQSNIDVIRSINGKIINSIELINNGYRTNNNVWNVNFVGKLTDIDLQLTDKDIVETVKANWNSKIANLYYKNGNLAFPTTELEAAIEWTTSNEEIISTTGVVTIPAEPTVVTVTAVITKGLESVTLTKEIKVGLLPSSTTADLKAGEKGDFFQITGTVTGIAGNATYSFEDAEGAISIYVLRNVTLEIGFEYTIIGTKDVYNDLVQIRQVEAAVKGEAKALPEAVEVTAATIEAGLVDLQSKLININNAIVSSVTTDNFGNVTIVFAVGTQSITMKWDSRMALSEAAEARLETIAVGDVLNVVAAPLGWSKGALIGYNHESQLVSASLTDTEKLALDKDALVLANSYTTEFTLPTSGDQGTVITWLANPETSLVDGKLVIPNEGEVSVTLTATLTLGEVVDTKEFTVTLKVPGENESFTETFTGLTIGSSYGDGSFTGVNGVVWNWIHARDIDTFGIEGAGILLRRANEPSSLEAKFTNGITTFSFQYRKAYTGGTERAYKVVVTANGTTLIYDIPAFGSGSGDQPTVYTFNYTGAALTGEVTVKIYATGNDGNQQATFDNFTWTENK